MATETYSIANDTLNGAVDAGSLHAEILASSIVTQLVGVSTDPTGGDNLYIEFVTAITSAEKASLDTIVANHSGASSEDDFLDDDTGWSISVEDRDLTAPPASPTLDTYYIVATGATGDWATRDNTIASWNGLNWQFQTPSAGFGVWVKDEETLLVWTGSTWSEQGGGVTSVFGTEFHGAQSTAISTTTSNAWRTKVTLNTSSLVGGSYILLVSYGWSSDTTRFDFEARVRQGATVLGEIHKQEAKDSSGRNGSTGTDQRHYATRHYVLSLSPGSYTFTFEHRTQVSGNESSTWDVYMSFWRVA